MTAMEKVRACGREINLLVLRSSFSWPFTPWPFARYPCGRIPTSLSLSLFIWSFTLPCGCITIVPFHLTFYSLSLPLRPHHHPWVILHTIFHHYPCGLNSSFLLSWIPMNQNRITGKSDQLRLGSCKKHIVACKISFFLFPKSHAASTAHLWSRQGGGFPKGFSLLIMSISETFPLLLTLQKEHAKYSSLG